MFLSKFDEVGEEIQRAVFDPKYMTTPLATSHIQVGVYEYLAVYFFGIRIALLSRNTP